MILNVQGWRRFVYRRTLINVNLCDALQATSKYRPYDGIDKKIDPSGKNCAVYRFRMHVGASMSGDYAADLIFEPDDVIELFKETFGGLALSEIIDLLAESKS